MNIILLVLLGIVAGGIFIGFFTLKRKLDTLQEEKKQDQSILLLQQQIQNIVQTLDTRLGQSHQLLQSQFGTSTKIIQDVTERLAKLDETNRQVVGFATQLQNLQDVLQNPKQRGILGEYFLESVLKNVLPPDSYSLQYKFLDGEIVDAVVRIKDKLIPIDSKFSLENYNRVAEERDPVSREKYEKLFKQDLKNRIDETSKYIRPEEQTMDFAFMFIPAEGIYYDLLINKVGVLKVNTADLIEYAFKQKRVIIVSPTSFFAYLQTVLQGLRALQIEESAKEIRTRVELLGKHLLSYEEYLKKLGLQLGTTVNTYNLAYKEFGKVDKDVMKITGNEMHSEVVQLEKPTIEN